MMLCFACMYDVSMCIWWDMNMLYVRSWKEHDKWKLRYSLVCFTQDDYVMLISHMKGYDERKFSYNHNEIMIMFIQGVNLLWPMISLW